MPNRIGIDNEPHRFDAEWRDEIARWAALLIVDPGWKVEARADCDMPGGDTASISIMDQYRRATITYNPYQRPTSMICCHEVLHILVIDLQRAAESASDALTEPAKDLAWRAISLAKERTCTALSLAVIEAFRPLPKEHVCPQCGHHRVDFPPSEDARPGDGHA